MKIVLKFWQALWHHKGRVALGVLALGAVWGAFGWVRGQVLEATVPRIGLAVEAIYTTGNVEATQMVPLAPRSAGWLSQLMVDEGDEVAAGQPMAMLDAPDQAANVASLRAKEHFAAQALARLTQLVGTPAHNPNALAEAKSTAQAAKAARVQAEAQLGFTRLVAPVSGTVVQRDGEIGSLVAAGQPVFYLASGPLRITTQVDEEEIAAVQPGMPVLVRADAIPDAVISGTVLAITPRGDATGRTFRVRIALPENTPLKIGMTTEVNIVLRQNPQALLVPTSALRKGKMLWQVKAGRAAETPVTLGARGVSETEILGGIDAQSRILTNPPEGLENGQKVWVRG